MGSEIPMADRFPATPAAMFDGLIRHRGLLWDLVRRDFIGRYKGSMLGVAWSLFNPLLMLAIYTIVFSVAFKARWGIAGESKVSFAIVLFAGIIIHNFFAECLNRAPGLITGNAVYVKKVVFPREMLSWMTLFSALLHLLVSFVVLLLFCIAAGIEVHAGVLLAPLVLVPLILMTLGLSWIFASLGVYLRDLSQVVGVVTTIALFLAPVFYPADALPEDYRWLLAWNPISLPVVQLRDVMLWNRPLDWELWTINVAAGVVICCVGYWWFQKSRRGFADVV
jgi:lipopolysaccharide transport system permease protein